MYNIYATYYFFYCMQITIIFCMCKVTHHKRTRIIAKMTVSAIIANQCTLHYIKQWQDHLLVKNRTQVHTFHSKMQGNSLLLIHISVILDRLLRDFSKQKRVSTYQTCFIPYFNNCLNKDLESTKQAYNKLLQEKTNLMTIVGEVDRLKKELNEANKVCSINTQKF